MSGNLDGFAGLRIPSHAGLSFRYRKSTEAYDGYLLIFFQRICNAFD